MSRNTHTAPKDVGLSQMSANWATILYPESAKDGWMEYLQETGIPIAISPLHDKDVTEDGEIKKPHYHIVFHLLRSKSRLAMKEITIAIGSVGLEKVNSLQGYIPYLAHMFDDDKAQYDADDIQSLNGFDAKKYLPKVKIDKSQLDFDIKKLIRAHDIREFWQLDDLIEDAVSSGDLTPEHYTRFERFSYKWKSYLDSKRHSMVANAQADHEKMLHKYLNPEVVLREMGFERTQISFEDINSADDMEK